MSYLIALIVAGLIGLALYVYFRGRTPALVQGYAGCRSWCEGHLNGCGGAHPTRVPEQPVNTYTNLIYAAAGVFLALDLRTGPAFVFALAMVILCVASSLYHALSTYKTGRFDVGGMYTVFSALAVYALCVATDVPPGWTTFVMFAVPAILGLVGAFVKAWYRENVNWKIAIFLIVAYLVLVERIVTHNKGGAILFTVLSFGLFTIAIASWLLDKQCKFPLQRWGHGVWHLLTGVAIGMLFIAIDRAP